MSSLGIRVEGVASQIGAMGGKSFKVNKTKLIKGLCVRYGADREEASNAIYRAVKLGVCTVEDEIVYLNMRDDKKS